MVSSEESANQCRSKPPQGGTCTARAAVMVSKQPIARVGKGWRLESSLAAAHVRPRRPAWFCEKLS